MKLSMIALNRVGSGGTRKQSVHLGAAGRGTAEGVTWDCGRKSAIRFGEAGRRGFAAVMIKATSVKNALNSTGPLDSIFVNGWVRTRRDAKSFSFIELNDGSCLKNLQVIADAALPGYAEVVQKLTTGAAVSVMSRRFSTSKRVAARWAM